MADQSAQQGVDPEAGSFEDQLDRLLKGEPPTDDAQPSESPAAATPTDSQSPVATQDETAAAPSDVTDAVDDSVDNDPPELDSLPTDISGISDEIEISENAEPQPDAAKDAEDSLESQLDALLSGTGAEESREPPSQEVAADQTAPEPEPELEPESDAEVEEPVPDLGLATVPDETAEVTESAADPADTGDTQPLADDGDQLGTQLDDLLAAAGELPPPTAESPAETQQAAGEDASEVAEVAESETVEQPAEGESIQDLDEMLSEHADEAVADEFETPAEVAAVEAEQQQSPVLLGDDADYQFDADGPDEQLEAETPEADAAGAEDDASAQEIPAPAPLPPPQVAPQPTASTSPPKPAKSAKAKGGPVSAASLIGGFQAGAQAVAEELDEDATGVVPDVSSAETPAAKQRNAGWFGRLGERLSGVMRVMAVINTPLRRCSPQTRAMIGYIGLITLFNGIVLIILAATKVLQ